MNTGPCAFPVKSLPLLIATIVTLWHMYNMVRRTWNAITIKITALALELAIVLQHRPGKDRDLHGSSIKAARGDAPYTF